MPAKSHLGLEPDVLAGTVAWDIALGDTLPGADPHSTVPRAVEAVEGYAPQHSPIARRTYGAAAALVLPYLAWKVARLLLAATARVHVALYEEASLLLLRASISIRPTVDEALAEVSSAPVAETALSSSSRSSIGPQLEGARRSPAERLTRLAHNLTGNVVGPLFYFALLGVPGALAYRVVHALSDRWGRREGDPLGTTAAGLDGVASYVPARLSAAFLAGAARVTGGDPSVAWGAARREGRRGRLSNDGWAEGALAGALGVRLEGPQGQPVNEPGHSPSDEDLARARRLFYVAAGSAVGAALAIAALRHVARRR